MTKTTAILFLTLFLFNLAGYKCWYYYLQQKEQSSLESRLDAADYNEKDLVRLTVPLSMPYQISWSNFERVDGEARINGVIYKYVKRKVENGQLILLCLPNYKKMKLEKASTEFGCHGEGIAATGKKSGSTAPEKNLSPTEYEENTRWVVATRHSRASNKRLAFFTSPDLSKCFIASPGRPPQLS